MSFSAWNRFDAVFGLGYVKRTHFHSLLAWVSLFIFGTQEIRSVGLWRCHEQKRRETININLCQKAAPKYSLTKKQIEFLGPNFLWKKLPNLCNWSWIYKKNPQASPHQLNSYQNVLSRRTVTSIETQIYA